MAGDIQLRLLRGEELTGAHLLWLLITGDPLGAQVPLVTAVRSPEGRKKLVAQLLRSAPLEEGAQLGESPPQPVAMMAALSITLQALAQARADGPSTHQGRLEARAALDLLLGGSLPEEFTREVQVIPGAARAARVRLLSDPESRLDFLSGTRPGGEDGGWWALAAEMTALEDCAQLALLTARVDDPALQAALAAWEALGAPVPTDLKGGAQVTPQQAQAAQAVLARLDELNPPAPLPAMPPRSAAPTMSDLSHSGHDLHDCLAALRTPPVRRETGSGTLVNLWIMTRLEPLLEEIFSSSWYVSDPVETRWAEANLAHALISAGAERPWTAPLQTLLRRNAENQEAWEEARAAMHSSVLGGL